jgi:hypothetical protein
MDSFIKVLSTTGAQYVRTSDLVLLQVDNNGATDWYVKAVFSGSLGSYAVIDGVSTDVEAHKLARELTEALSLVDPEMFKS